jgi:polygalacturonase
MPGKVVARRASADAVILSLLLAFAPAAIAQTDPNPPTLPTIGSAVYNVTVSNPNIDGGAVAVANGTSTNNTTVINDFIAYAAANGGGTVEIPAASKAYGANELLMGNNVDLDVVTGATLQNLSPDNTFITTAPTATGNMEISGGGIINDNATNTSANHMIILGGVTNLAVENVTIENSSEEHLVTEGDTNVTINNVTIQDSKIQANTDGIDFAGSNFLIENCNISDGDDDIVAKPESSFCSNIYITGCTITNGHGISIGGQTNAGLNGMYVTNCTLNGSSTLEDGIHLKAGDGTVAAGTANGGLVQNVTFNNITINNVDDAIVIDSFYNNGKSNFPSTPSASKPFSVAPTDSTEPLWQDITFENITITDGSGNAADIYGLNSSPANMDGINFENITAASSNPWNMYYSDDVYMSGNSGCGRKRPAGQFRMRLRADKERMHVARQFQNLHDRLRGMLAAEDHAVLFEHRMYCGSTS